MLGGWERTRIVSPPLRLREGGLRPPKKSQTKCGGSPKSPGASRSMPGEKVLSRIMKTGGPQAWTIIPRMHCASQPRAGHGCPWQQQGSQRELAGGKEQDPRGTQVVETRRAGWWRQGETRRADVHVRRDPPPPPPTLEQLRGELQRQRATGTESQQDLEGGGDPTPRGKERFTESETQVEVGEKGTKMGVGERERDPRSPPPQEQKEGLG